MKPETCTKEHLTKAIHVPPAGNTSKGRRRFVEKGEQKRAVERGECLPRPCWLSRLLMEPTNSD
ncbi:unnamed protein product [Acanthoscelides obtectus]|uniref:Uncharacterized protein n=1 Tax=Acanthoscelides obtectus TaxID=200917 RepID=A0A9P0PIT5_ACAOB|nr:unnamed protein product [Acanthoscelides obtectus]CAK1629541.1 hypothetical protein AOBTE_LOCUS5807 [Acanthoscelides obtectus]